MYLGTSILSIRNSINTTTFVHMFSSWHDHFLYCWIVTSSIHQLLVHGFNPMKYETMEFKFIDIRSGSTIQSKHKTNLWKQLYKVIKKYMNYSCYLGSTQLHTPTNKWSRIWWSCENNHGLELSTIFEAQNGKYNLWMHEVALDNMNYQDDFGNK